MNGEFDRWVYPLRRVMWKSVRCRFRLTSPLEPLAFKIKPPFMNGESITVEVVISDLIDRLQGFEFDLDFNNEVITATNVSSSGFLPTPITTVLVGTGFAGMGLWHWKTRAGHKV